MVMWGLEVANPVSVATFDTHVSPALSITLLLRLNCDSEVIAISVRRILGKNMVNDLS